MLAAKRQAIEESVHYRMAYFLNADVELMFYDTTSLHFEIDDEDEPRDGPGANGRDDRVLRKCGKSKKPPRRRPAARGEAGGDPRRTAGVPLDLSRQY